MVVEKDRDATEQRLIEAIGQLIEIDGFENLGVNAVAKQAGVSKILIYRYFNSLDELIFRYMESNDFWINIPDEMPLKNNVKDYLKKMFRKQISQLRKNPTLKRLHRWELSSTNPIVVELREKRERNGLRLLESVSQFAKVSPDKLAAIATIIVAAINYLVLLEEQHHVFNDINIQSDAGWEQIAQGIDILIDLMY